MPEKKRPTSVSIKRFEEVRDKSRNEQQKSILLKEIVETKQQQTSKALKSSSEKIIARSKELCEQAKKLRAARTRKGH